MDRQADTGLFAGIDVEGEDHSKEIIEGPFRCPGCGRIKTHQMYALGWHSCDSAMCFEDWTDERRARGLPVRTDTGQIVEPPLIDGFESSEEESKHYYRSAGDE